MSSSSLAVAIFVVGSAVCSHVSGGNVDDARLASPSRNAAGAGDADTVTESDADVAKPTGLSPLNAYLGLDPVTGEPTRGSDRLVPASGVPSEKRWDDAAAEPLTTDRLLEELARFDADGPGSVGELGQLLGLASDGGSPLLADVQRWATFATLALLLWPLAVCLAEVFAIAARRRDDPAPKERRVGRRRSLLRFGYAAMLAIAIAVSAWAASLPLGDHSPTTLAVSLAIPAVALLVGSTLKTMAARAERDHLVALLRDLRADQRELRRDVAELHGRLGRSGGEVQSRDALRGMRTTASVPK